VISGRLQGNVAKPTRVVNIPFLVSQVSFAINPDLMGRRL
jgi:hypothetical protein